MKIVSIKANHTAVAFARGGPGVSTKPDMGRNWYKTRLDRKVALGCVGVR